MRHSEADATRAALQSSSVMQPKHPLRMDESTLRVLIVDDDRVFLRYAERALESGGYQCELAGNVERARAALRAEKFDVLVLDIHLPDGTGIELLHSLPELSAELPVLVVTGQPSLATAVAAMRLDVMDYLSKPEVDLRASIERATTRFRRARHRLTAPLDKASWAAQLRAIADYLGAREDSLTAFAAREAPSEPALERSEHWAKLSRRETEVVQGLLMGHAPAEVAAQMGIELSTARNHIQSAYRRLGVRSQLELIAKLRQR